MGFLDNVLQRMGDGKYDGNWSESTKNGVSFTLSIKDGVPKSRRVGKSTRVFNGKENERISGKVVETVYNTPEQRADFIRKYGFIDELFGFDNDAKKASREAYQSRRKGK